MQVYGFGADLVLVVTKTYGLSVYMAYEMYGLRGFRRLHITLRSRDLA
jgi:hypothetical protein